MKNYKELISVKKILNNIKCDICKKDYDSHLEWQEFIRVYHECGYKSVFGDGEIIELDICQYCFKEKFGEHIKLEVTI